MVLFQKRGLISEFSIESIRWDNKLEAMITAVYPINHCCTKVQTEQILITNASFNIAAFVYYGDDF